MNRRVFGDAETLQALLDSLNAAVFGGSADDGRADHGPRPAAH